MGKEHDFDSLKKNDIFKSVLLMRPIKLDLDLDLVGKLEYNFTSNKLKKLKVDTISINNIVNYAMGVCTLERKAIALVDYNNSDIILLDKSFAFKKRYKYNSNGLNPIISPVRLEGNSRNLFYILDRSTQYVHIAEINDHNSYSLIKILNQDYNSSEYLKCKDICFYDYYLYTLNIYNSNVLVKKFSQQVKLKNNLNLNTNFDNACLLKLHDNLISVVDNHIKVKIFDFNGNPKYVVNSNEEKFDSMCFADNNLLILNNLGVLKCYELPCALDNNKHDTTNQSEDFLILNVNSELKNSYLKNDSNFMTYFDSRIFVSNAWKRQFCILNK